MLPAVAVVALAVAVSGCGGGNGGSTTTHSKTTTTEQEQEADAGQSRLLTRGVTSTLRGTTALKLSTVAAGEVASTWPCESSAATAT